MKIALLKKKNRIPNATENSHYDPQLETRVKCDASRSWRLSSLKKCMLMSVNRLCVFIPFFNSCEERYSVSELEFLGIVRSMEYFKNYFYGKHFTVSTDHRALLSILEESRSSKSYSSRLTRWIDRLTHVNLILNICRGENQRD